MPILQIEHEVPDYDAWKKAFDNDPINRKSAGVKDYRICRTMGEPCIVIVEVSFDDMEQLQSTIHALQNLWNKVQGTIMLTPKTRIIELMEANVV